MRTTEENRIYMSEYMSMKYKENLEVSREKSRQNYYRNKHSTINKRKRIDALINKLSSELLLLIENNTDCNDYILEISNELYDISRVLENITTERINENN